MSYAPLCSAASADCRVQNVPNWDRFTIVGTSQEIFKDYLRLTSVSLLSVAEPIRSLTHWVSAGT